MEDGKVIKLFGGRRPEKKKPKEKRKETKTKVIAITSGKGGVGKTNIVANLGYSLSRLGKKVLLFDTDLALGNLDLFLGLTPHYNISHFLSGEKTIQEIIKETKHENLYILPASSGVQKLTELSDKEQIKIINELDQHINFYDFVLIDTATGISSNVMHFNLSAQEIMFVVQPEPTSVTDTYALMKVMNLKYNKKCFKLIVNNALNPSEAKEVHQQMSLVTDRFLSVTMDYFGYLSHDKNILRGIRHQRLVSEMFPDSEASRQFGLLAQKLIRESN